VAPLGFAYRNAPVDALKAALLQTLIPTHHLHPWAIEGALAQALAVAHLSKLQPPSQGQAGYVEQAVQPVAVPAGALEFLRVLQEQLRGHADVMCGRLRSMEQKLEQVSQTMNLMLLQVHLACGFQCCRLCNQVWHCRGDHADAGCD
jgi:ADP-ribosylglycohydrolase